MVKLIKLCPVCGEPLVWSFINPGCEWMCICCKGTFPMFCGGESIDEEHEEYKYYEIKQKMYTDIFKVMSKHIIPPRSWRKNCKKCKTDFGFGEYHLKHATKLQKMKHEIASKILEEISLKNKGE